MEIGNGALLVYTVVAGFLNDVPRLAILNESIRNTVFSRAHVVWHDLAILAVSVVYAIKYLNNPTLRNDIIAKEAAQVGILLAFWVCHRHGLGPVYLGRLVE